ncbi:hypothetical protein [Acinetobacter guerrae]|uniref:hypothetical protein n=1 Tax=Acinetobacter guerrae TaxID=1843371 RepID=UPI00128B420B|nr:hypothetical protein [Acinetobacter guerrae]MPW42975.1 hypothetical protein [Acinetobacter guerrae]
MSELSVCNTKLATQMKVELEKMLNTLGITVVNSTELNIFIASLLCFKKSEIEKTLLFSFLDSEYEKMKLKYYIDCFSLYLTTNQLHERDKIICILATVFIDSIDPDLSFIDLNEYVLLFSFKNFIELIFL